MEPNQPTGLDFARELDFSRILTNPFLDIAARFWEKHRYEAFQICYRSMRRIDDLVDDRREAGPPISASEVTSYTKMISEWLASIRRGESGDSFQNELLVTLEQFSIPLWPWDRLCRSMAYDLDHNGFKNFAAFLRYTEGAAIAPASVFMHLCGVSKDGTGYSAPEFDIRRAARPLALFSYLVHIIRDFQKDQSRHLNYFADDLLAAQSLTVADLSAIANGGEVTDPFRELVAQYVRLAGYYRDRARAAIDKIAPLLEARYELSLEIIFGLYSLVFEQIDPKAGNFTGAELNPSERLVQARLEHILAEFRPSQKS